MRPSHHRIACWVILGLSVGASTYGQAAPRDPKQSPPEARRLLDDVAKAYRELSAYADHGKFTVAMKVNGKAESDSRELAFTLVRPNKMVIDAGEVRLYNDGATLAIASVPTRKFMKVPASRTLRLGAIANGPLGAMLFGGPSGPTAFVVLSLLLEENAAERILAQAERLALEADRRQGDQTLKVLRVELSGGAAVLLLIDPADRLIRRAELVLDEKALKERAPAGVTLSDAQISWTSGALSTQAPKEDSFAFQPPAGFSQVKAAEAAAGAGAEPAHELLGKAAPDFKLTVLDGEGKTKTLTKADLLGKVVVLDFWATWCGPCLAELPEVQKIADAYAKAKKNVIIIAVSQDRLPDDGSPVRKLVEQTLADAKLSLATGPITRVALDPDQVVGDLFLVEGLPTVVVLDAKGTIQSAQVGFADLDESREELIKMVDTLLAGGSLLPAKTDAAVKPGAAKPK